MSFPPIPPTEDEKRSELLRLMSVRGYPNVYVLGCFARYVTIYAQQVRALNLVHALASGGVLSGHSAVAVVGGGIAGLTAAAAAAVRGAARVEVFEKEQSTMRLQRNSGQRFVHPFIYDWPRDTPSGDAAPAEAAAAETDLPLMNWTAGIAREVVQRLDTGWEAIRGQFPGRLLQPHTSCGPVEVLPGTPRPILRVDGGERPFDVVILAVGFGKDVTPEFGSYWSDTGIDGPDVPDDQRWLVSGAGDGALTDLMRLCVADFWQDNVIRTVAAATRGVGAGLLEAERRAAAADPGDLTADELLDLRYAHLREPFDSAVGEIAGVLGERLKPRKLEVTLVASERDLVAGRSSVLNRLVTLYLLREKRFHLRPGRLEWEPKKGRSTAGRWMLQEGAKRSPVKADRVLARHGPDRALGRGFPAVAERCRALSRTWAASRQHDDWTRKPLYHVDDFTPGKVPPLRVDFGEKIGTVVVGGVTEYKGQSLPTRVAEALRKVRLGIEAREGREIELAPVALDVREVFEDSAAYERAVRALCVADIAVFDLTGYSSAVMVLLGIRAAVRRGVTITVSRTPPAAAPAGVPAAAPAAAPVAEPLPFNLAALNPIWVGRPGDYEELVTAIEAGFTSLRNDPNDYLDLPAFDALRQVGEYRTIPASTQVLFLCWFNQEYQDRVGDSLKQRLYDYLGKTTALTTLDSRSPQLIEQRLYAEIRRSQLCVVDWTGYRPNVFFELGVRLASSSIDPLSVVYRTLPPEAPHRLSELAPGAAAGNDEVTALLRSFFAPAPFDTEERGELERHLDEFRRRWMVRMEDAKLSPGRTFRVVCEALHRRQEPGGREVHDMLLVGAERLAGPAVPEAGELPVLFGEALAGQVRRASVEYLAAAWFYLDGRYRLLERRTKGELADDDPILQELLAIGRQLRDRLRHVAGEEYDDLSRTVGGVLLELEPRPRAGDAVGRARWLKARAIHARDVDDLDRALSSLAEAAQLLHDEAARLREARETAGGTGRDPGEYERDVLEQIPHVLGSMGGILRSRNGPGDLEKSADVYDQGYTAEQRLQELKVPMSYNLVQRLVARALLEPAAVEDDARSVRGVRLREALRKAAETVDGQLRGTRARDVWAAADLALLRVLMGGEGWEDAVERFLAGPPAPDQYALRVTRQVVAQLKDGCETLADRARALTGRLRFARDEISVALDGVLPLDVR